MAEAIIQRDFRLPAEEALGPGDVGTAALGIVLREGFVDDAIGGAGELDDALGELEDGVLLRVAEVDDLAGEIVGLHEEDEATDEIVYIAEGAGLLAGAVDGDGAALDGLDAEVGDDAAIRRGGAGAIGVEDAGDAGIDLVLADVFHGQGFGEALAFVVAGAGAIRVDVAPVGLDLGVDKGIAIDLGGGSLHEAGAVAAGELQRVMGAVGVDQQGLDRVAGVALGAGRAGEIVDAIEVIIDQLGAERLGHILRQELEVRPTAQVVQIVRDTGQKIIRRDDIMPLDDQALHKVATDKPGTTGYKNTHRMIFSN